MTEHLGISMSETQKPNRKRHFSTIVVLLLVAFVLLNLNMASRFSFGTSFGVDNYALGCVECGWPLTFSRRPACIYQEEFYNNAVETAAHTKSVSGEDWICHVRGIGYAVPIVPGKTKIGLSDLLTLVSFIPDLLIAIAILWGTAIVCEWLIRRLRGAQAMGQKFTPTK